MGAIPSVHYNAQRTECLKHLDTTCLSLSEPQTPSWFAWHNFFGVSDCTSWMYTKQPPTIWFNMTRITPLLCVFPCSLWWNMQTSLSLSLSYCFKNVVYVSVSIFVITIAMTLRKRSEIRICRFQWRTESIPLPMIVRVCIFSFLLLYPLKDDRSLDERERFETVVQFVKRDQDLPLVNFDT